MSNPLVCILTAGQGQRMGHLGKVLNKALFPINKEAIISSIITKFPRETKFVIGLGFLGEQVKKYLSIAHPKTEFIFVEIENYKGEGSGPGHSLLCCESELQNPFYFVSCDTLWANILPDNPDENWVGVSGISNEEDSRNYCNMEIEDGIIVSLRDKTKVDPARFKAFIGLCYIKDFSLFFNGLKNKNTVAGEHQISNGLIQIIENSELTAEYIDWTDVGSEENYKEVLSLYENYDFSKSDEVLYLSKNQVIKMFVDEDIVNKRVLKAEINPDVFPKITHHIGQFYAYDFQKGQTLYEFNNQELFKRLLDWLKRDLWNYTKTEISSEEMRNLCKNFYFNKTMHRIKKYEKKYEYTDTDSQINGLKIPNNKELFSSINWESLYDGVPSFMHGDLQFDNILYDSSSDKFTLLDWRQDFSGEVEFGDLYYDLAKLNGGLFLNYDLIKLNLLDYQETQNDIFFDFAQRYNTTAYKLILDSFILDNGYDLDKVNLLTSLIYLNMSPLHHFPFDKMLFSLGRYMLFNEIRK